VELRGWRVGRVVHGRLAGSRRHCWARDGVIDIGRVMLSIGCLMTSEGV
jgi:hypothetical protein